MRGMGLTKKMRGFEPAPIYLTLIISLMASVGLFYSLATQSAQASTSAGAVIDPPRPLQDFSLTHPKGRPMHLTDPRGRLSFVFFRYTNAPPPIPPTMANFSL